MHDASFAFYGIEKAGDDLVIVLASGRGGCTCGCGAIGRGMAYRVTPDFARIYAGQLSSLADEVEQGAADQATAALARAAAK